MCVLGAVKVSVLWFIVLEEAENVADIRKYAAITPE